MSALRKYVAWRRNYRVVKLVIDGKGCWLLVSVSMREDETWDMIGRFQTRAGAFDYLVELYDRNQRLADIGAA